MTQTFLYMMVLMSVGRKKGQWRIVLEAIRASGPLRNLTLTVL
jgi:hypothetical protein